MFGLPSYIPSSDEQPVAAPPPPAPPPLPGIGGSFLAGLKSGGYGLAGTLEGAASGAAKLVGANATAASLAQGAHEFADQASQVSQGLDQQGWTGGGFGGFARKAAYTLGNIVPSTAGVIGAGAVGTLALPELAAGSAATTLGGLAIRAGAALPEFFGGAGAAGEALGAGALSTETAAAGAAAFNNVGRAALGAAGATIPLSFGEQVNAADEKNPEGISQGGALRALAQSVPLGLLQSIAPAEGVVGGKVLAGAARTGLEGAAQGAWRNAAAGALGAGAQAAADASFDPNMTPGEMAQQVVSAATGSAIFGGLVGGGLGFLAGRKLSNQDLQAATDQRLAAASQPPAGPVQGPPAPPAQREFAFQAPFDTVAEGTQTSIFDVPRPYQPGVAPMRTDQDLLAQIAEARAARAQPEAAPQPQPTPADFLKPPAADETGPPLNAAALQTLKDAKINLRSAPKSFRELIANSTAKNLPELYNELLAVDPSAPVASSASPAHPFNQLIDRLGVGDNTLDEQIARLQANPDTANAKALARLQFKVDLRDAAAALREAQPAAEAPRVDLSALQRDPNTIDMGPPPRQLAAPDRFRPQPGDFEAAIGPTPEAQQTQPFVQMLGPEGENAAPVAAQVSDASPVQAEAPQPAIEQPAAPAPVMAISDRVLDAARSAVGEKGGEVSIADLRKALPDVAPKDLENALREIHADDTDTTLTQNPKGQRTGVDGVSVPGQGRFHKLDLAPAEVDDAVREPSAAPEAVADRPEGGSQDGGGDQRLGPAAGADEVAGTAEGQSGTPAVQAPEVTRLSDGTLPHQEIDAKRFEDGYYTGERDAQGTVIKFPYKESYDAPLAEAEAKLARLQKRADNAAARGTPISVQAQRNLEAQEIDVSVTRRMRDRALPRERPSIAETPTFAPQPHVPPATPEAQAAQATQTRAAANMLAAPDAIKQGATDAVVAPLRRRAKAATAIRATPEGDQLPTAAVGAQPTDLAQAMTPVADKLQPAPAPAIMVKTPFNRMPNIDTTPIPRETVDAEVARAVGKLRPAVRDRVHVVGGEDELPDAVRNAGLDLSRVPALYHNGEVYIRADQMRSVAEVQDAISHEVFGHLGTAEQTGPAYMAAMARQFDRAGGIKGIEALARERGVWAPNDDGANLVGGTGMKHYMPPEGMALADHVKARVMDELIAHAATTDPSALGQAIQGITDSVRKGIVNVLRRGGLGDFARAVDKFTPAELTKWVSDSRAALADVPKPGQVDLAAGATDPTTSVQGTGPTGQPPFMAKVSAQQADAQGVMGRVSSLRRLVDDLSRTTAWHSLSAAAHKALGLISPQNGIAEQAARWGITQLKQVFGLTRDVQNPIRIRMGDVGAATRQAHKDLSVLDPAQYRRLNEVMALATGRNIDPRVPFEQHSWLMGGSPEQRAENRQAYDTIASEYQKLGQPGKGGRVTNGQQIFNEHADIGQFQWFMSHAQLLHDDGKVFHPGADIGYSPAERYAGLDNAYVDANGRQLADQHFGDIGKSLDFARAEYSRLHSALSDYAGSEAGENALHVGPLRDRLKQFDEARVNQTTQGPYFHLGRKGDYAVAVKIAQELDSEGKPTGRADPAALQAIVENAGRDFPNVGLSSLGGDGRQIFARFNTPSAMEAFADQFREGGALSQHIDPEAGVYASTLDKLSGADSSIPMLEQHLTRIRDQFDALIARQTEMGNHAQAELLGKTKEEMLGYTRAAIMDLAGDGSMRSLNARRDFVQGYNLDMHENQQQAASVYAHAISSTAVRNDKLSLLAEAQRVVDNAARTTKQGGANAPYMQQLLNAYIARDKAAEMRVSSSFLQNVVKGLHFYSLGFSPGYFIMNLSQVPTLTAPELLRYHSIPRTAMAMAQGALDAGKVLTAMVRAGHTFHGGITQEILDRTGLSQDTKNLLNKLQNRGDVELGSYASVNSGVNHGALNRVEKFLHLGNQTAILAEVTARLVSALSAKRLYDGMPAGAKRDQVVRQFPTADLYASHVVQQSQFQWGSYNTPKAFTAGGVLGPASPAVFKFHGFVPRLAEKIVRESLDGFTNRLQRTLPPEQAAIEKRAAQNFMLAHAAAVITISGTLGLPAAGAMAGLATKLSGLFNNGEAYDFEAHYRSFIASVFGKDLGEVIARGLPRYAGVDMSELGDENMVPMTRLLEDRQRFEDAFPDYLAHAWGSGPGAMANVVLGMRDMAEGRVSEAMARALPTAFRNIARAYRVGEYGVTNGSGEKLPVETGTADIIKTALGFESGDVAEEKERQASLGGLRDDRTYWQSKIMRDLTVAQSRGDTAGFQAALDAARNFDQQNPGQFLTRQIPGILMARARTVAAGQALGTLGLKPTDVAARQLVNY